ncbi:MAG: GxxExxY protein [Kiritimatiellae bacterium]|nr:GxxExxY protein [Kiritimatiellia bacterium]
MQNTPIIYPDEAYAIRGAVFEVYHEIGNGFREEVYQQCLEKEFAIRGIPFEAKKELRIYYKGEPIEKTYIPDFLCYGKIIVEIKTVNALAAEHRSQVLNYLKLTGCRLGLLVNFASYPKAIVEHYAN